MEITLQEVITSLAVFAPAHLHHMWAVVAPLHSCTAGASLIGVTGAAQAARFSEALQGAVEPLHVQAAHFREALGLPPVRACPWVTLGSWSKASGATVFAPL